MTGVFAATPMYGGQCYGAYCDSMIKLALMLRERNIAFQFFPTFNQSHIDVARNVCVDEFLKSEMTHLLFVDSDLSFKPEGVLDLLDAGKDIICGFYPKKKINWKTIVAAVKAGYADEDPDDLQHFIGDMVFTPALNDDSMRTRTIYEPTLLHEGGTGFMLIARDVFERLSEAFPELAYHQTTAQSDMMCCFFNAKIDTDPYRRFLTEDYDFCRLARTIGIDIWLAPWIKLTHHGYYQFIGDIEAISAAKQGNGQGGEHAQHEVRT